MLRILMTCLILLGCIGHACADELVRQTAAVHGEDRPEPTPVASTAPRVAVSTETVVYASVEGRPVSGFLARPANAQGDLPGLIVIHEWWGLNDNIRQVAQRLAGEGYVALAVDLYRGDAAASPKQAMQLMQGLQDNIAQANENLRQAYAYLSDTVGAPRIGVVGWCLGGQWSLRTALLLPAQVDAAVIYYGSLNTDPQALSTLQMPILGNFAENDPLIPLDTVAAFESTLRET
jgi:carboxymethylenebutenolidase